MARHPHHPDNRPPTLEPRRLDPSLYLRAAMRLLPAAPHERMETGRRFLAGARAAGYDLSNMWGTVDDTGTTPSVREVCLAIEGPGRTAMCFVSGPADGLAEDESSIERAACIGAVSAHLNEERVRLVQALPEPHETWAVRAYEAARFVHVGELAYMQLDIPQGRAAAHERPTWPTGIRVRSVTDPLGADCDFLLGVLEASYIRTLDCPELCGLRATADVLESHLATGAFDPTLWQLAFEGETAVGCSLVSVIPENGSAELVYIGLSPAGRGRGLGAAMLRHAIAELRSRRVRRLVCAVDRRNAPALGLYARLGFREFSARTAWVCPIPMRQPRVGERV